jgi:hypothetical protein
MITEIGSIRTNVQVDYKMQRELNKKFYILSIPCMVLGGLGILLSVVYYFAPLFAQVRLAVFIPLLLLFLLLFLFGVVIFILITKANGTVDASKGRSNLYEFFHNFFLLTVMEHNLIIQKATIYNFQISRAKETKHYFFFYITKDSAYPVLKTGLCDKELNALREQFCLPVKGEALKLPRKTDLEDQTFFNAFSA